MADIRNKPTPLESKIPHWIQFTETQNYDDESQFAAESDQIRPFLSNLDYLESVITQKELRLQKRNNIAVRDPSRVFMTPSEYRKSKLELQARASSEMRASGSKGLSGLGSQVDYVELHNQAYRRQQNRLS